MIGRSWINRYLPLLTYQPNPMALSSGKLPTETWILVTGIAVAVKAPYESRFSSIRNVILIFKRLMIQWGKQHEVDAFRGSSSDSNENPALSPAEESTTHAHRLSSHCDLNLIPVSSSVEANNVASVARTCRH